MVTRRSKSRNFKIKKVTDISDAFFPKINNEEHEIRINYYSEFHGHWGSETLKLKYTSGTYASPFLTRQYIFQYKRKLDNKENPIKKTQFEGKSYHPIFSDKNSGEYVMDPLKSEDLNQEVYNFLENKLSNDLFGLIIPPIKH